MIASMFDSNVEPLRQIAEGLKGSGGYWQLFKITEHLMGWLYDGGCCVYCDIDLVEEGHTTTGQATRDHLLPKRKKGYPELHEDDMNAVAFGN